MTRYLKIMIATDCDDAELVARVEEVFKKVKKGKLGGRIDGNTALHTSPGVGTFGLVEFNEKGKEVPYVRATIALGLVITNTYHDGVTNVSTIGVQVARPEPADIRQDDFDNPSDWLNDEIFPHTGTGRGGEAIYEVKVASSSDPDLVPVDTLWVFGG